jgi:hypothetical protein
MLCNDGYDYFYSYGFKLAYCLPVNNDLVLNVRKYDYEDLGGVYVYDIDEYTIRDYDLDEIVFHLNSDNSFYVECIKKYEELEDEEEINFENDAKHVFEMALSELTSKFKRQLLTLEESLKEVSLNEDKDFLFI